MAEDELRDASYEDDDDFDFFYVEDTCPLAEELAETSVPDPGYAGNNAELAYEWYEYDFYEYWDDLEYGHDSYWDSAGTSATGQKRKRADGAKMTLEKRRKLSLREVGGGTTVFVSFGDRQKLWARRAPPRKGIKSFALLPDWRTRSANAHTIESVKAMPAEMRQAAEGNDEDTPEGERFFNPQAEGGEEGDWEDEAEDAPPEDINEGNEGMAEIGNVDLEAVQTVLRQRLADSGLQMSEDGFMQTMMKMLSGDTNTDDAAGDLANSLLGSLKQGSNQDQGLSGWLSRQGVSLDDAEEDEEDAESVATAEMPESSSNSKKGKGVQISPPDSAIEMGKAARTSTLAMHDGSPKATKKRLASIADEEDDSGRKRKKVTFDVPASQESQAATAGEAEEHGTEKSVAPEQTVPDEPATDNNDLLNSEPAATAKPTRGKARAAKTSTAAENSTAEQPTASTAKGKAGKAKAEPVVDASGPARSTRKRKAEAEEEPPPPKKQTKKSTTTTKNEADDGKPAYARATRATRARSGK